MVRRSRQSGPAGIFSTDNPVSDQMQIDAETWDEEYEDWEEEYPETAILYGCCPKCFWWDKTDYEVEDPTTLDSAKELLRKQHKAEKPDCDGEPDFD